MPALFAWIILIGGLLVVAGCWLLPREIGKEDEPVLPVHVDLPKMEDIGARVREAAWKIQQHTRPETPVRPAMQAPAPAPQPMGTTQPVLADQQQPAGSEVFVLPMNGNGEGN